MSLRNPQTKTSTSSLLSSSTSTLPDFIIFTTVQPHAKTKHEIEKLVFALRQKGKLIVTPRVYKKRLILLIEGDEREIRKRGKEQKIKVTFLSKTIEVRREELINLSNGNKELDPSKQ